MAAGISNEEFQRLQSQLLDLRAANYTLMEESNRFRNEARNATSRLEMVEKEYQKAQRALEKSRKAKDVELLFAENEALQNKLLSQEEQFREQNQALLQELAILVAANEKLENATKNSDAPAITPEVSEKDCQCDLSTEHYEKLLEKERQQCHSIMEQLAAKDAEISALNTSISETRESLSSEVNTLKEKIATLQAEVDRIPLLTARIEEGNEEKSNAASEIRQLKSNLEETEQSFRQEIDRLQESHQKEMETLRALHAEEAKQYEIQVELATAQRAEFEEEAAKARQEREDALEDVRIAERKRLTDTADLRRQLRVERKRADKLQERLRDFIPSSDVTNGSSNSSVGNNHNKSGVGADTSFVDPDNCSVSSWSLMSGQNEAGNGNHPATPSSPYPPTDSPSSGSEKNGSRSGENGEQQPDLVGENSRLVSRLATMQQEKWRLEERVLHLEEANAAMADEMVKRGKLIQHYCMEGRSPSIRNEHGGSSTSLSPSSEKLSVRRMVSLIRQIGSDPTDGDADGQQRRIQRMLEETLTKNMHLQEDVERLSQEVVRLSQLVGSANLGSIPLPPDSAVLNPA